MSRLAAAATTLDRTGLGRIARRAGRWRGALVLVYHRIRSPRTSSLSERHLWSATQDGLDDQLGFLRRHLDVVPAAALAGDVDLARERVAVVTFDDGFRDNHDLALPVLRAHGLTATFFLATGFLDRPRLPWWDEIAWLVAHARRPTLEAIPGGPLSAAPAARPATTDALLAAYKATPGAEGEAFLDALAAAAGTERPPPGTGSEEWMSWDMARALRDAGMGIGAHTHDHPVLSRLPREAQRREVETSRRRLREELGIEADLFAYPVGLRDSFSPVTREVLREAGVKLAFSYYGGMARAGFDPLDVPRSSVGLGMDRARFRALVTVPRVFARW